jgi:hypothetical protein
VQPTLGPQPSAGKHFIKPLGLRRSIRGQGAERVAQLPLHAGRRVRNSDVCDPQFCELGTSIATDSSHEMNDEVGGCYHCCKFLSSSPLVGRSASLLSTFLFPFSFFRFIQRIKMNAKRERPKADASEASAAERSFLFFE